MIKLPDKELFRLDKVATILGLKSLKTIRQLDQAWENPVHQDSGRSETHNSEGAGADNSRTPGEN